MSSVQATQRETPEALLARIRAAALREAARRDARARSASPAGAHASADGGATGQGQDAETRAMVQALEEERLRNDHEWKRIRQILVDLGEAEPAEVDGDASADQIESALRASEVEVQRLDFEIKALTTELSQLPEKTSAEAQMLDTRAALIDSITQYDAALLSLNQELASERAGLESDRKLLADLRQVGTGLRKRAEIEAKKAAELTPEEIIDSLKVKLKRVEVELSGLLNSLIATSDRLFSAESDKRRGKLRALLDALMNKAWDTPADPYIQLDARVPAAMLAFLVRANVALEHPSDARRLRLIPFQRRVDSLQ